VILWVCEYLLCAYWSSIRVCPCILWLYRIRYFYDHFRRLSVHLLTCCYAYTNKCENSPLYSLPGPSGVIDCFHNILCFAIVYISQYMCSKSGIFRVYLTFCMCSLYLVLKERRSAQCTIFGNLSMSVCTYLLFMGIFRKYVCYFGGYFCIRVF
jgi:hypothetical protein